MINEYALWVLCISATIVQSFGRPSHLSVCCESQDCPIEHRVNTADQVSSSSTITSPADPLTTRRHHEIMDTLSVELHGQIFEHACIDDGSTARSLALPHHLRRVRHLHVTDRRSDQLGCRPCEGL